jgi:hypothetical protein
VACPFLSCKNWLIKLMRCDSATGKFVRQTIRAYMTCIVVFMPVFLTEVIASIGTVKSSLTSDSIS